jgi:hypothetical protein
MHRDTLLIPYVQNEPKDNPKDHKAPKKTSPLDMNNNADYSEDDHFHILMHAAMQHISLEEVTGRVFRLKKKRTPAMSAGLTDHVWSLRELLGTKWYAISTD